MVDPENEGDATSSDYQVGGSHYSSKAIQPIHYIYANQLDFYQGNVVKYVTRYKEKNGLQDLMKAKHYLEMLIDQENGIFLKGYPEEKNG
jgi:hypothetical protein